MSVDWEGLCLVVVVGDSLGHVGILRQGLGLVGVVDKGGGYFTSMKRITSKRPPRTNQ